MKVVNTFSFSGLCLFFAFVCLRRNIQPNRMQESRKIINVSLEWERIQKKRSKQQKLRTFKKIGRVYFEKSALTKKNGRKLLLVCLHTFVVFLWFGPDARLKQWDGFLRDKTASTSSVLKTTQQKNALVDAGWIFVNKSIFIT